MIQTVEWEGKIERRGDERIIVLPREIVLEGETFMIRQDDWGDIAIYPTSPEGREALKRFGPLRIGPMMRLTSRTEQGTWAR